MTKGEADIVMDILDIAAEQGADVNQRAVLVQSAIADMGPFPNEYGDRVRAFLGETRVPEKVYHLESYLGEQKITEMWVHEDNDIEMAWKAFWEGETRHSTNPDVSLVVTCYNRDWGRSIYPERR